MDQHYICITPDQGIVFPSVTYMRNLISKAAVKQGSSKVAVNNTMSGVIILYSVDGRGDQLHARVPHRLHRGRELSRHDRGLQVARPGIRDTISGHSDNSISAQPVYWFATNANVISTLRAVTGHDLKLIAGPIELMKYHNTPPKLKVSKDTDMVTIEEETPPDNSTNITDNVNKTPMPESLSTLFTKS